jgi:hypothetical protein
MQSGSILSGKGRGSVKEGASGVTTVFIPTMLQSLAGGVKQVDIEAANVRQVIDRLDELYPGVKARLVEEGRLRPNLSVAIDGEVGRTGLLEKVGERWRCISYRLSGAGTVSVPRAD